MGCSRQGTEAPGVPRMRRRAHLKVLVASLAARAMDCLAAGAVSGSDADESTEVVLRAALRVANETDHPIDDARVWFIAPLARTASHTLLQVGASVKHRLHTLDHGHRVVELNLERLLPHSARIAAVQLRLARADHAKANLSQVEPHWSAPSPWIESDDGDIVRLSQRLRRDNALETARAIHHWVAENVRYLGYRAEPAGAAETLRQKAGDCTDMACLAAALARASDIPARQVGGYAVPSSAVLRADDYHDWAELYLDGTWRISDPQKGRFMQMEGQYVGFRLNGVALPEPMGLVRRYAARPGQTVRW